MRLTNAAVLTALLAAGAAATTVDSGPVLKLEKQSTPQVYFTYGNTPLLALGNLSDFLFDATRDDAEYRHWAEWVAERGINRVRAYPSLGWKRLEDGTNSDGGSKENILFPYAEVTPGIRQFDLNRFNEAYWEQLRAKCEYLRDRGVIIHLLMWNGSQLRAPQTPNRDVNRIDWLGHFFNPENNVNAYTDHLNSLQKRYHIYDSVADGREDLIKAQLRWFQKLVEETADLGNVYYDLAEELGEQPADWSKTQLWIDAMVGSIRKKWDELCPGRQLIIGMDAGGVYEAQRDWIFSRPYFNVLIYGKKHTVEQARSWRERHRKPYIPKQSWDDNGERWSSVHPEMRVHTRKYMWKLMMAKVQQVDLSMKPRWGVEWAKKPWFDDYYNPRGWNLFEDDARLLREFWWQIKDYANLWFHGTINEGPGEHRFMLASSHEAIVYLSSGTRKEGVRYEASKLKLSGLSLLEDSSYHVDIFDPEAGRGLIERRTMPIKTRRAEIDLPAFADDLAVHIWTDKVVAPRLQPPIRQLTHGPKFHWFGYYDKLQFDPTSRYVLGMEVNFEGRTPTPDDVIKVGMIDLEDDDRWIELGETRAWGWQQGCMLQWIPGSTSEIIWNDREGNRFVARILNVFTGAKRTIPCAVYTLSPDGKTALSTDFARIQSQRPGYGYKGLPDPLAAEGAPESGGIWKVNLKTGAAELIISHAAVRKIPYTQNPPEEVKGTKHWFNHLLFNPDGTRFIFLERWRIPGSLPEKGYAGVRTRMFTAAADGSDIRLLDPYGYTSHFIWRDPRYIMAWAYHPSHNSRYYLYEDMTNNVTVFAPDTLCMNGHNSYLPGNQWILNDANALKPQPLYLYNIASGKRVPLGDFAAPEDKYRGEWRCDLHPRFSPDGTKIVIDSPHNGGRQLYLIDVSQIVGR